MGQGAHAHPHLALATTLLHDPPFRTELPERLDSYFTVNAETASSQAIEWDGHKVVVRGMCMSTAGGVRRTVTRNLQKIDAELYEVERGVASGAVVRGRLVRLQGN
ncbi:hypothetical protein NDU88_008179 [Pleurodeles waltl]|uniref:Uncharacterized protein n=1 Tax=Pleurodeles waltl TaxID=8319 RepID=A0AAV7QR25_PLEWA|nr:hypothetical protein NDU88_008179 [Pleurodeles waltl]